MGVTNSPNMNLPIPNVGTEPGPQYATDVNNSLTIVDQHDHSAGSGVQINPSGLNINSALSFNSNFATNLAGLTLVAQSVTPSVNTIYQSGVDLYFVDGVGNNVRITQSGAVAGTPGSISNLVSPASASYVGASSTFVWQSNTSIAANMDFGAAIMRNLSPNSTYALTLQPPAALSSNYSITLPILPAANSVMTINTSGVISTTPVTSLVPAGAISMYGGASAPSGYLICDGSSVSRSTYAALFAAIGTAYGTADGSSFNLPDLRGKFPRGVDNGAGNDPDASSRTAQATGGNTGDNVGSIQSDATDVNGLGLNDPGHVHSNANSGNLTGGFGGTISAQNNAVAGAWSTPSAVTGISITSTNTETRPVNVYVNFIIKT